jgi:regulator of sirC expression with transglutaminase-like and TPR domain
MARGVATDTVTSMSDGDAGAHNPSGGHLSPVESFAKWAASVPVPLDRAALAMSAHCREDRVDEAAALAELDRLGAAVREPTPGAVVELLFNQEGFGPNRGRFADPANSYLDLVVSRRRGIPITLAVVTIEVARRAGVVLHGVGMPGHFLVGTPDPEVFIDAFDGCVIDRAGAAAIFARFESRQAFEDSFLQPTPPEAILLRMLNNLRTLHLRQPDAPSLVAVLELLTQLPGCPIDEFMRLGQALATLGRPDEGARALEGAADRFGGSDADHLRQAATRLWAQLN